MKIEGIALLVGDDIDTDLIIPTFALQKSRDPRTFADYAFYHTIPEFKDIPEKIIVAGHNFGCGSSREEAVFALLYADVKAVLAKSFAPIFERNAFNNALLCVQMDTSRIRKNNLLKIDLDKKTVHDATTREDYEFTLSAAEETLIRQGGLLPMLRKRIADL
ncbi:MAG: 3-isopropylmalate dehydratase small subunit [Candidatus Methanofastidiosia archaeon]